MAPAKVAGVPKTPNQTFRIDDELHGSAVLAMRALGSNLTAAVVALCGLVTSSDWARYWAACKAQDKDPFRELAKFVGRYGRLHTNPSRARETK